MIGRGYRNEQLRQAIQVIDDTCCGAEKKYAEPLGWHQPQNAAWLTNLQAAGVHPEEIDYVFCSHLHSDHCGWNTRLVDGRWQPTFPNAKYVFARDEYRAVEEENHQIYIDNVLPIMEVGQAVLVDLDYALDDEIWLESTPGHSAGHVAINLKSGVHRSSMCGDLIHSPLQLAEPDWNCNSDTDIATAIKTRRKYLDTHCDTDTVILTAHFPSPSVGHIVSRGDCYDFVYC